MGRLVAAVIISVTAVVPAFAASQCLGTTKQGRQCRNKVANGSYCYLHAPTAKKCAGTTKSGAPCGNNAQSGSSYCHAHGK